MQSQKKFALDWVDHNRQQLSDWHQIIWHYAEPAFREYKSCAWYVELLRKEGFTVEEGSGGMPTAFCATFSNGEGPILATYAEYDAVPGNCQAFEVVVPALLIYRIKAFKAVICFVIMEFMIEQMIMLGFVNINLIAHNRFLR